MENHLFECIASPLPQIYGQIGLNTNSTGGLRSHFWKFESGTRNSIKNLHLENEFEKSSSKTSCGSTGQLSLRAYFEANAREEGEKL